MGFRVGRPGTLYCDTPNASRSKDPVGHQAGYPGIGCLDPALYEDNTFCPGGARLYSHVPHSSAILNRCCNKSIRLRVRCVTHPGKKRIGRYAGVATVIYRGLFAQEFALPA